MKNKNELKKKEAKPSKDILAKIKGKGGKALTLYKGVIQVYPIDEYITKN
ncbi:MAG TPA: hypothetical protein PLI68_05760 [Bacteroidia bacterium]|nr:hypothetical protein [Bacteroidia bacterium]